MDSESGGMLEMSVEIGKRSKGDATVRSKGIVRPGSGGNNSATGDSDILSTAVFKNAGRYLCIATWRMRLQWIELRSWQRIGKVGNCGLLEWQSFW